MNEHSKDEEMICALTADEHAALRRGLRQIPATMPPRDVWRRIREQAEAEGLFAHRLNRNNWFLGAGLAAAASLVAIVTFNNDDSALPPSAVVPQIVDVETSQYTDLFPLMVESRQLESDLRSLPSEPRVAQAGTVATITDLEDRIAAIDYQLNDPREQLSVEDREIFWRERVKMMRLLLQLRYAQAQRAAF